MLFFLSQCLVHTSFQPACMLVKICLLFAVALPLSADLAAFSTAAGEIKDYNSDEDLGGEERLSKAGEALHLSKPPLKKKGSVALDLLVNNLVGH